MARIRSTEKSASGDPYTHHMDGAICDQDGIVFDLAHASPVLIINMQDGERIWTVILSEEETRKLAEQFADMAKA
jgi:hypothetical protein